MKTFIKKLFLPAFILAAFTFAAHPAFAAPDVEFNDVLNVTPMTGDYIVTTSLDTTDITSFSNVTLIGLIDPDNMDMPIPDIRDVPINVNVVTGTIPVTLNLSYDPEGYAFQFCLVNDASLAAQGGINLFNPNNPSNSNNYQLFTCTGISWYLPDGQGGNNTGGNTTAYEFQSNNALLEISGTLTAANTLVQIIIEDSSGAEVMAAEADTNNSGAFTHTFSGLSTAGMVPGQTYTYSIINDSTLAVIVSDQSFTFPDGSGGSDLPPGFNVEEDCYDILYVDDPVCQDFLNSTEAEFNPNFILTTTLQNPLGTGPEADINIIEFLQKLFKVMVKIALPFLILFTIYSGFMFIEARGNTDKLEVAKKNFLYVIIGALLVFGAWMIAKAIEGTVNDIAAMGEIIKTLINLA